MQLQPGTLILNGKFRIKRRLGGGASAEVYEATQVGLDAPRALKILRRDLPGVGSTEVTEYAARFALEGRLQARLKGHPRIVQVYDTDTLDDAPVLIMEYCEGGSLEAELDEAARRGQPLSVGRVVEVLQDIADGLAELHRLNCVHRDVKPGNILLDGAGRAKIGDLGLAQVAGLPSVDRSGWEVPRHPGTPGYASPEHAVAQAYLTPRADIFALGVVGYRMLTGRMPDGTPPARRPQADRADVPDWLDALVLRMLAFDPRQRPEDGGAVAEAIRRERQAAAERAQARAAQATALRARIEEALNAGRLVEADTLMDELLQLDADDLAAQTLARRVNRALVEEKQRLAREERLSQDEERARSKREDEERQARLAEVEAIAERKRLANAEDQQRREAEQNRRADEVAKERLAAEAKRQAAPQPLSAPALKPVLPPTGSGKSRRAVLIGAGTLGALGLGWLATRGGGGEAPPAAPTPAPTRIQPTPAPAATDTRRAPTAAPAATNTSPPPTATPNPALRRIGTDRAILTLAPGVEIEFVRVPAGEFVMGSDKAKDSLAFDDELPQHRLNLGEYWIGKTEVTVAQFAMFARASSYKTQAEKDGKSFTWTGSEWKEVAGADWAHPGGPATDVSQKQSHPVNHMSWDDGIAFCGWASKLGGGEVLLPSEAEWEKAARGMDGRIYPWGSDAPDDTRLNYNLNVKDTTPVGKYGAKWQSPSGCDDMAGNVWEWTRSIFKNYPYAPTDGREDLASRDTRVLRGGSFNNNAQLVRCACRFGYIPGFHVVFYGFRVILRPPSL